MRLKNRRATMHSALITSTNSAAWVWPFDDKSIADKRLLFGCPVSVTLTQSANLHRLAFHIHHVICRQFGETFAHYFRTIIGEQARGGAHGPRVLDEQQ